MIAVSEMEYKRDSRPRARTIVLQPWINQQSGINLRIWAMNERRSPYTSEAL